MIDHDHVCPFNIEEVKLEMGKSILKGWRFAGFVGAIVGAIGITIYPIIIRYWCICIN